MDAAARAESAKHESDGRRSPCHGPAGSSARVLTLSYTWLGHARPGPREELQMKTAAERVVAEVGEACAPGSPSGPECVMMIPFAPSKPCRTAA